jgi:hypothetical protein
MIVSEIKINNLKDNLPKRFQPPQELFNSPSRISSFSLTYPLKGKNHTEPISLRVCVQSPYTQKQLGLHGLI